MTFYIRGIRKSFLTLIDSGSDCNFFSYKVLHPRFWTKMTVKISIEEIEGNRSITCHVPDVVIIMKNRKLHIKSYIIDACIEAIMGAPFLAIV